MARNSRNSRDSAQRGPRNGIVFLAALALVFGLTPRLARAADDDGQKREAKSADKAGDRSADKSPDKSSDKSADKTDKAEKAAAVVDKAIEAVGGADKLGDIKAGTWKTKGKITLNGDDNAFTSSVTVSGLRQFRQEFQGTFNGQDVKGTTVLNGDQGWRRFNDETHELDKDALANERRNVYLQVAAIDPLVLKLETFKVESVGEEKVGDKPAEAVKVTTPDDKEFTLYFDKQSGLPVREVAKVHGWDGEEFTQDVTFSAYKDFDGIKKATKIEVKRDGEKFISYEITEFKPLTDKAPADQFEEPK